MVWLGMGIKVGFDAVRLGDVRLGRFRHGTEYMAGLGCVWCG